MLEGVVPFPPEFAEKYRARGYWRDKPLRDEFSALFRQHAPKVAVIDGETQLTYADLERQSTNLALNLLDAGMKPGERIVVALPNGLPFVILHFALQKIGAIPILALVTHRYREITQFVELSGAVACAVPERQGDFEFPPVVNRIRKENPGLRLALIQGRPPDGFLSLEELISLPARRAPEALADIEIDPAGPALFLLSGGTTGIPKLIPRTHNDYSYNSRTAAQVTRLGPDSVGLLALPIGHNLPLGCPGLQGILFNGGKAVLSPTTRPEHLCALVERHRVTHLPVVPALLIGLINHPAVPGTDFSSLQVIQSGGQSLQPEIRLKVASLLPHVFVQENFGMAEGVLMFVRFDDPDDVKLETVGRPICPDDEVRLLDEEDNQVPDGQVGEMCCRGPYTLRGYFGAPEHNAVAFTSDGFYRSGDMMRRHPSGNYVVAGRKKDLINRGGEKISAEEIENLILSHPSVKNVACVAMPDKRLGERMCACLVLQPGTELDLPTLATFLEQKEIARHKLPERVEIMPEFPVSTFGKVSKKALVEMVTAKIQAEAG